jgi:hypothetical protein
MRNDQPSNVQTAPTMPTALPRSFKTRVVLKATKSPTIAFLKFGQGIVKFVHGSSAIG